MALKHTSTTVGNSPTMLITIPNGCPLTPVHIFNSDNSSIFVGDASIATSGANRGLEVVKSNLTTLWLNANDVLYAVSSNGTSANAVTVVYSGVF